jgi:penicillin-binding protein 1B
VVAGLALLTSFAFAWQVARDFPRPPYSEPSRLFGTPEQLTVGDRRALDGLAEDLEAQGYREVPAGPPSPPSPPGPTAAALAAGSFRRAEDVLTVHLRRFPVPEGGPDGEGGGAPVEIRFKEGRIAALRVEGRETGRVMLEPPLLATYYGPDMGERRAVRVRDLPPNVVRAVLAAEDDGFSVHPGISVLGIGRAAWTNLREGEVRQGGSTITQQLVKNVYLGQDRNLWRKVKEAALAVLLEVRYGKDQILEAYLNEIYWGKSGSANLMGLGAAAHAYFGKEPSALTLAEAATLAGMIRAPADLEPVGHPEESRARRDDVLRRLAELEWVGKGEIEAALRQPLATAPQPAVARRLAPYVADAAAAEAEERFGIDDLDEGGWRLFSTIRWRDQTAAEAAVADTLRQLDKTERRSKRKTKEPLQAALISVDPGSGAVLAYVGGRDYAVSQFDRASHARRQAGSTAKPLIYATAFAEGIATPATPLLDSPIVVRTGDASWRPHNNDRSFHGQVTVRAALARSINIPSVRLALQVGLPRVIAAVHDFGIEGDLEPVPALALGAFEVTPRELATAYATLASGGLRPHVHLLSSAVDAAGEGSKRARGEEPAPARRVLRAQSAYLVTSILQGALDSGTAAGARSQGVRGRLAGKTGTTNGRRDNWFAGYSPDRATVVWVGYDDNRPTRLSGSSAALPLWSRFVRKVRPAGGWPDFEVPPGITTVEIDPATGKLATDACPERVTEVFPDWQVPAEPCPFHGPWGMDPWMQAQMQVAIDPRTGQPIELPAGSTVEVQVLDAASRSEGLDGLDETQGTIVLRPSRGSRAPVLGTTEPAFEPAPADTAEGYDVLSYEEEADWGEEVVEPPVGPGGVE